MYRKQRFQCLLFIGLKAIALSAGGSLPDEHAPIGVMGEHSHKKGGWMVSYRYTDMLMDGNRDGSSNLGRADVLQDFPVVPVDMRMEMHSVGIMYGVSDRLTLMSMLPYTRKSMTHITRMGSRFKTVSEGLSDIKLMALQTLYESHKNRQQGYHKVLLNIGLSLPTGSIDEEDDTPAGPNQKLPYPMQLGSGTYDPILGVTYVNQRASWSWGGQVNAVFRLGNNSEGYRQGNERNATLWIAKNLNKWISVSLRLEGKDWGNIHGNDSELNPSVVPTARSDLRGGKRVDLLIGLNLLQGTGIFAHHRLALEFGMPVYQNLDGPQLQLQQRWTLGWQWAF